jgi:flagellar FliL protein
VAVVVLLAGGGAAYFFLMGSDEPIPESTDTVTVEGQPAAASNLVKTGTALYVAIPRPFVFNVPGSTRDRIVEIKVQLLVRGSDNEEQVKMHIPSIEGTLLTTFSTANADDLATAAGKIAIRDSALKAVQQKLIEVTGNQTVEEVLFTGFVMQ